MGNDACDGQSLPKIITKVASTRSHSSFYCINRRRPVYLLMSKLPNETSWSYLKRKSFMCGSFQEDSDHQSPRASAKTGIEIYSVNLPSCESHKECEFIAPHSVETLLANNAEEKPVSVLYFAPSKCVCVHCLLSERLELSDPRITRNCLSG